MAKIELITRDVYREIKQEIDDKFVRIYKIAGRAKWKKKFSSSRRLSDTFGRWNR